MTTWSTVVALAVAVGVAAAQSCTDKNPTACARKRTWLEAELKRRSITDVRTPFTGNFCAADSDSNSMRDYWCCATCESLYGGTQQKEVSYMNTPSGETCQDTDNGRGFCTRLTQTAARIAQFCPKGALGWRKCKESCGWCAGTSLAAAVSTAASCVTGTACTNQTTCTAYQGTASTTQGCTSDGTNAGTLSVGTCMCKECESTAFKNCTSDADCAGGIAHACEATKGACKCDALSKCKATTVCTSDADCGNVKGACGYIKATTLLFTTTGCDTNTCNCLACPGTKPCYSEGTACNSGNAAETCGDANFCIDTNAAGVCASTTATTCTCQCSPEAAKMGQGTADGKTALSCVQGANCGQDNVYGCGNADNCVLLGTTTKCNKDYAADTAVCECACATKPIEHPNKCLGASQTNAGVAKTCTLGTATECGADDGTLGFATGTTGLCLATYTEGATCACGTAVYPKSTSNTLGGACTSGSDCISTTDTAAMCDLTATDKVCILADKTGLDKLTGADAGTSCSADTDCGWGKCVDAATFKACTAGGLCKCLAAGCDSATAAACSLDDSTACGLAGDCEGKCSCA